MTEQVHANLETDFAPGGFPWWQYFNIDGNSFPPPLEGQPLEGLQFWTFLTTPNLKTGGAEVVLTTPWNMGNRNHTVELTRKKFAVPFSTGGETEARATGTFQLFSTGPGGISTVTYDGFLDYAQGGFGSGWLSRSIIACWANPKGSPGAEQEQIPVNWETDFSVNDYPFYLNWGEGPIPPWTPNHQVLPPNLRHFFTFLTTPGARDADTTVTITAPKQAGSTNWTVTLSPDAPSQRFTSGDKTRARAMGDLELIKNGPGGISTVTYTGFVELQSPPGGAQMPLSTWMTKSILSAWVEP